MMKRTSRTSAARTARSAAASQNKFQARRPENTVAVLASVSERHRVANRNNEDRERDLLVGHSVLLEAGPQPSQLTPGSQESVMRMTQGSVVMPAAQPMTEGFRIDFHAPRPGEQIHAGFNYPDYPTAGYRPQGLVKQSNDQLLMKDLDSDEEEEEDEPTDSQGNASLSKEMEKSANEERKGECQLLYEANNNSVQLLLLMAIGLVHLDDGGEEERRCAQIQDEPYKSVKNPRSVHPTLQQLQDEMN